MLLPIDHTKAGICEDAGICDKAGLFIPSGTVAMLTFGGESLTFGGEALTFTV